MSNWENFKPNWYKAKIHVPSAEKFEELMIWMQKNLPAHRKHTLWRLTDGGTFEIRFRYERDYEWFMLRWS
jgi:hypothetical protein